MIQQLAEQIYIRQITATDQYGHVQPNLNLSVAAERAIKKAVVFYDVWKLRFPAGAPDDDFPAVGFALNQLDDGENG